MQRYKKWAVAGTSIAFFMILSGCGTANHSTGSLTTNASGTNQTVSIDANPAVHTQNSSNANRTTSTETSSASSSGMVHLILTNAQIKMIKTALKNINGNPNTMEFANGVKVYVPAQIPRGQQLLNAVSGGNEAMPMYVSLQFSGFNLSLLNKPPVFGNLKKDNTVTLTDGTKGTWYTYEPGTGETTYYFEYSIGRRFFSFYSNLKTVSQAQIEQMASQQTFLGSFQ